MEVVLRLLRFRRDVVTEPMGDYQYNRSQAAALQPLARKGFPCCFCITSDGLFFDGAYGLIVGLGVDIAEVERIKGAIERHGETFLRRVYTPREISYCEGFKNKFERYAGRFAAKEAAMKALGTGWRRGVRWVDVEVVREKSGRPTMALAGEAKNIAKQLGVKHIALSITHTETEALAQVIFEN